MLPSTPCKKKEKGKGHTSAIEFGHAEHGNPIMPRGSCFTIWYTMNMVRGRAWHRTRSTTRVRRPWGLPSGEYLHPQSVRRILVCHKGYRKPGLLCHWSGGMFLIMHDLALEGYCVIWPEQVTRLTLTTIRPMSGTCRASGKRTDVAAGRLAIGNRHPKRPRS